MDILNIDIPIIVEGKYDKDKILKIAKAYVIQTNGFSIFNDKQLIKFIQKLAINGIIVLTDSDGAGLNIRNKINSIVQSKDKIYNIYIPQIVGKEKRKIEPSKEGYLGVEGVDTQILYSLLLPFDKKSSMPKSINNLTKTDFFNYGLSGQAESKEKRKYLCKLLSLPDNISSNALLDAINLLISKEEFFFALSKSLKKLHILNAAVHHGTAIGSYDTVGKVESAFDGSL